MKRVNLQRDFINYKLILANGRVIIWTHPEIIKLQKRLWGKVIKTNARTWEFMWIVRNTRRIWNKVVYV